MYEHLKNDFIELLEQQFNNEEIEKITKVLDKAILNYEVTKQCTSLVPCFSEEPELVKKYLVCKKIAGLSEETLYNYRIGLRKFFMTVNKQPQDIESNDIRIYLYMYQEKNNISNRSLDKLRQTIGGLFQWLQDEEYIVKNPMKKIPKIKYEVKPRQSLTQMELEYVRKACNTDRERAMVEVLYSTGCRVSELARIKITDVDFTTKKVHLFGKGSKHRDSFINAKAEVSIKQYLKNRNGESDFLFVSEKKPYDKLSKAAIEKIVRNISARTEDNNKNITPHIFRHTTATTALKNGMPIESIQKILGHSSVSTTEIYLHMDNEIIKLQHKNTII